MEKKYKNLSLENILYVFAITAMILMFVYYGHYIAAVAFLLFFLFVLIYNVKYSRVKDYMWEDIIEKNFSKLDSDTRNVLTNLPFSLVIISNEGNIVWHNKKFTQIIINPQLTGKNINEFIKRVNVKDILKDNKKSYKYIKLNNKYYDIYANKLSSGDENDSFYNMIILYFSDATDKYNIVNEIENLRESVILIEVDNLSEVVKSTPEDKKPLLKAEIERNINSYAQSVNAMFKKYSTGKYVLVIQNKNLQKEMEKKFEILDVMREINVGNTLAVTLSIGVGRGSDTPIENYNSAVFAKELALGRGGDQTVIKKNEKLFFYGGKTKEVEKRTKVRARIIGQSLVDLAKQSSNVIIMGHNNPDIDCFGSAIGIYSSIRLINSETFILVDSSNSSIKYIYDKIKSDKGYQKAFKNSREVFEIVDDNTLLILVDVNSRNYVQNQKLVNLVKKTVIIDHHRKSANYIDDAVISYVESYASSTSELVTEMVQYMNENYVMKPIEAEALLAGICVDTKNFYFKTGVRTFEAAAYLRKHGADTIDVKKLFSSDLNSYIEKSQIIKSATIINKNIAIAVCPSEIKDSVIAAKAADELLNITGIEASFVLIRINNDILISGRSFGDINVQVILEKLGGGGHMTMAGAKVEIPPDKRNAKNEKIEMDETIIKIKKSIGDYLKEGD
ncbi:MAG: DHH family phosphoesterase [Clostridium sp.]|nr:DHH family phosphoesterase [Clostridium sp.]